MELDQQFVSAMAYPRRDTQVYSFGPFKLLPAKRLLLNGALRVRLGSRALEILVALVERAGEVVSKEELIARVWPDTYVEEGNVKVQIAALRRAFQTGAESRDFIATSNGRGYRFVAPIEHATIHGRRIDHNLPIPLARASGRESAISTLTAQSPQHRLVTIVGAGGIGKTTVALEAAERLLSSFNDGVWFVDLRLVRDPRVIPNILASVLGVMVDADVSAAALSHYLRDRQLLIVLDNCEHLRDAAAAFVDSLITGVRNAHVLATSRDCLRVPDEWTHRLEPLELAR